MLRKFKKSPRDFTIAVIRDGSKSESNIGRLLSWLELRRDVAVASRRVGASGRSR